MNKINFKGLDLQPLIDQSRKILDDAPIGSTYIGKGRNGMKTFTKTKLIPETEEDVLSLGPGDLVYFHHRINDKKKYKLRDVNIPIRNGNANEDGEYEYYMYDENDDMLFFYLSDIKKVIRWEER